MNLPNPMHLWFFYLFEQRMDKNSNVKCFECGKMMSEKTWKHNLCCYSHILSKKTYSQFKGKDWNIKIVHPDCHNLYTKKPSNAINQWNEYIKLKELYERNK